MVLVLRIIIKSGRLAEVTLDVKWGLETAESLKYTHPDFCTSGRDELVDIVK